MDEYDHPQELSQLVYTPTNIPGPGCPEEFFVGIEGCSCSNGCNTHSCSCLVMTLRLQESRKGCCSQCSCDIACSNRTVDRGPITGLEIFKSENKGFGLRTTRKIAKGTFVCEYAGEVIDLNEAKKRFQAQQPNDPNYILVLNEHLSDKIIQTIIDPTKIGNIGRYINHSCDPNMISIPVRVESASPRIAFFALRDIDKNEELTYSYGELRSKGKVEGKVCLCGSENCCGVLPRDETLIR